MTDSSLDFKEKNMTLIELSMLIKKEKLSPVLLASTCLYRIKKLNSVFNSFITVLPQDVILAKAKECEKSIQSNNYIGPLHGIPFSVKDLIHVKDLKFTAGSKYYDNYISKNTAPVVKKLENAGAILIGSNNLNELASGITGKNSLFGDTKNPDDLSRISGGSSGGSAVAVATGMVVFSIGTDTGGSIRVPSSLCGVVGLKPTFGTISVSGTLPLSPSLDHIGIITRNTIDSQIVFEVIKSSYSRSKLKRLLPSNTNAFSNFHHLVLLYPANYFLDILDEGIKNRYFEILSLLRKNGFNLKLVNFRLAKQYFQSWRIVRLYEAAQVHSDKIKNNSGLLSEEVRMMLVRGSKIRSSLYQEARKKIANIKKEFMDIFDNVNKILLLPTTVIHAPKLRNTNININHRNFITRDLLLRNTIVFNSIGFPALTIPLNNLNSSPSILPIGLQIVGAPLSDKLVLRTGSAIESLVSTYNLSNKY